MPDLVCRRPIAKMRVSSPFDKLRVTRLVGAGCAALLAACSGGGGSPAGTSGGSAPSSSSRGNVTFQMQWAPASSAAATSALRRSPKYLAPTALSVSITVVSASAPSSTTTPIVEYMNSPQATLTFSAPTGQDSFLIQTYDEQNALGNVLSKAYVTQTVSGTSANVVAATLDGVVASFALSSSGQLTAGTPSSIIIGATAYDADGNVIVGPGTFAAPIQLSINDPSNSGALSLPPPSVILQPGGTVSLAYNGQPLMSANVVGSVPNAPNSSITIAPTPTTIYYTVPTANSSPEYMTVDGSNNIWFTETLASKIGKFAGGTITETNTMTADSFPEGITVGSDGRIWFTELAPSKIGVLQPGGAVNEYAIDSGDDPYHVVDRGNGEMWFAAYGGNRIGFVTALGANAETPLGTSGSGPFGITPASDGYIYFTEYVGSRIGRIHDSQGTIQEISLTRPALSLYQVTPGPIVKGPDGNLWFTDSANAQIGRVNLPAFTVTYFPTATADSKPTDITVGPDGALWYTETGADRIGRMTTSGVATDYAVGGNGFGSLGLNGIAIRSNGQVFFCASSTNQIGRFFY